MTIVAKLLMGPKKVWGLNDGTDHHYYHAKFGGNRMTHFGVRRQSVMFSLFIYFCLSRWSLNVAFDIVGLLQQEIASAFVGRF